MLPALPIVLIYFIIVLGVGLSASRLVKGSEDQLVAGRNLGLWLCTVAVVGEWLGGMSTIGVPERAYGYGISAAWYNVSTATGMAVFGFLLARHYRERGVRTVPEMLEHLFGPGARHYAAYASLIAYFVLSFVQLKTLGTVFTAMLDIRYEYGILLAAAVIIAYTAAGGLWSVTLTNVLHVLVILIGLPLALVAVISHFGGLGAMIEAARAAGNPVSDPFAMGYSVVLSFFLGGVFGALAAQASIQPVFAAKDWQTGRRASFLSAAIIAPIGILTATLGIAASAAYPGLPRSQWKFAVLDLLLNAKYVHPVIGGLATAAIIAAILSTVAPVLLALSTIFSVDVYPRIRPGATDREVLRAARLSTILFGIFIIPFAIYSRQFILDVAYISYAIRDTLALVVIYGIWFAMGNRNAPLVAKIAIAGGTAAGILFASRPILASLGIPLPHLDKVFASLASALIIILAAEAYSRLRR